MTLFHKAPADFTPTPSESLCNGAALLFSFPRSCSRLPYSLPCIRAQRKTEDTEARQTRERGSVLKSFRAAPVRALAAPQISNDHRYIIPESPFCAPRSPCRIDIISAITLRLVHVVIFRRLIAKAG